MSLRRIGLVTAGLGLTGALVAVGGVTAWADGAPSSTLTAAVSDASSSAPSAPSAPSAASTPNGAPGSADAKTDAAHLCKRVPALQRRIAAHLKRLNGPASDKGSIAALQARVDQAQAANETAVYTYLNNRLTFRKSLVPMLQQRTTDLTQVASWCQANGLAS